uniref:Crystallin beta-gamma domain containing 2 n=1 Tax=Calidris pygmaea TaxID=425635 RepID=A0A8C3KRZ7_9CHAR
MDSPFQHAKARGFVSSAELSMKQAVPSAPAPEGRSRFQKVSLVSRRLEKTGSPRGREGSPSRVSLLLQAWEREIVEKTAAAPPQRERSSSLNPLKDFTAHGPIFSQVYSPAQKPRRQDERGKAGGGGGVPPPVGVPREVPVHRESYLHGTLLPPPLPTERPTAGPGEGPGAPCGAEPGCVSALPRARNVTVLRTGKDVAGPEPGLAEGKEAQNEMQDATGATTTPPQQENQGQDGSGSAGDTAGSESSPGTEEATGLLEEASPREKCLPQAEATPENATPRDSDSPGDPQTSITSSPQCPSEDAGGQADPAGAGEGSAADGDGTISATPPRTESPPGAGGTPENPSSEVSNSPEPSSEGPASPKAEVELEGDEKTGDSQSTAQEPQSGPEPPAHDPPAESPPDTAEEDPELLVDMEIFVDTLRNMEPSEMRKAPKVPRQPRPSSLGRCAALPPIHEDRVAPRAPVSLPEALRDLLARGPVGRQEETPVEEVEIENPYLSPAERAAMRSHQRVPGDVVASDGRVEGGSLLGVGAEEKAKPVVGGLGLADARREAVPAPSLHCEEMAGATDVPSCSKHACPLGCSQQEDKEGFKKINTRPGKIILFSEAGFAGQKREIWGDVPDATSWELSHTISIRVIRGGWVMYEKPRFHGRKCVLAEGDVEIDNPWTAYGQSEQPRGHRPFRIGSFKRVVRDYRIPEISLFAEENGEGARLTFTDSAEDTRTQGQALAAASIIVHSGLWLVYSKPFFDDDPYVLEPGGYPNLKAWGAKDPSICSMHPIRLGCPVVERPGEPQVLIYEAAGFQGRSFAISRDIYDLKRLPGPALSTVGSLHVLGGCWVGYEKEGFRGHQYLLEEGEYQDWKQWGGYNQELVSLRLIRTDFSDPALVLFEAMDFEEGPSVELSEALPDTQLAGYGTVTQSIHVLSGVWVAYEGTNFSGEQYILEKGVYRNCEDWGASDCRIASAQPILQVGERNLHFISKILLFSEPDFLGDHVAFEEDQDALPGAFIPRSCRVRGGSWILFDGQDFAGDQHVLSEGEYPTLSAMGCLSSTTIRSLKKVPVFFSEPSIFLHGLECFEGKEIELNSEVRSLQAEGFNNHVLSVRVKGGIWVLCEHGDFRGRQWLLDCTEITNWLTYSGLQHVGSLYPIRQRRIYFRIRSRELELYLCVPDDVEDMKAGRVVVSSLSEQSSSVWYYEDGLIKNQVAPNMSLQVIGPAGKGAKAVLWSETRMPRQTWSIDSQGRIRSQMFEDMILDIKGGRSYDRDHAIVWDMAEERPTQVWDIQVL